MMRSIPILALGSSIPNSQFNGCIVGKASWRLHDVIARRPGLSLSFAGSVCISTMTEGLRSGTSKEDPVTPT